MTEEVSNRNSHIDETEIRKVLSVDKGSEAKLLSWDESIITEPGDNYDAIVIGIKVFYYTEEEQKSSSYVAKLHPQRATDNGDELLGSLFRKESNFYLELLPQMNAILKSIKRPSLCLPQCIHSSLEKGKEQIYLEDLRERGFQLMNWKKGLDVAHATLVLRELARLHASSVLLLEKYQEQVQVKYDYLDEVFPGYVDFFQPMFSNCLATAVNLLKKIGGYDEVVVWIENLKPQISDILTTGVKSTKWDVIIHGDIWSNNALFRYDHDEFPTEVMLIDMAVCRRASLAFDLNYFLWSSLSSKVRKPNVATLLNEYHASFRDVVEAGGMVMPFTVKEIMAEFRDKNSFGLMIAMMFLALYTMEDGDSPDLEECEGDFIKLIATMNRKLESLPVTDPLLKERFFAMIEEFIDAGVVM